MKGSDWCFHLIQPQTWDDFSMTSSQFLVWLKHQQVLHLVQQIQQCVDHLLVQSTTIRLGCSSSSKRLTLVVEVVYPNFWRLESHTYIHQQPPACSPKYTYGGSIAPPAAQVQHVVQTLRRTPGLRGLQPHSPWVTDFLFVDKNGGDKQMVSNVVNFHVHIQ